ncbi:MAG: hypothetical protein LBM02_06090 [Lachnospiraceae bacterium]|jgi:hypothetical protein|nr:hypothetical protein [Lachnospiraceae bacterium]
MKKKKIIIRVIIGILIVAIIYSILWFALVFRKYKSYASNMKRGLAITSYYDNSNKDIMYNVKYPDFPYLTGNLAVSIDDDKESLIIWPSIFGETEYGLQLTDDNKEMASITVDAKGKALENDSNTKELISKNQDKVNELFDLANKRWKGL